MSAQSIDFQADPRAPRDSGFVPQHTSPEPAKAETAQTTRNTHAIRASNRQSSTGKQQWSIDDKPNTVFRHRAHWERQHDRALREFRSAYTDRPDIEQHRYSFPNPEAGFVPYTARKASWSPSICAANWPMGSAILIRRTGKNGASTLSWRITAKIVA